MQAKYTITTEFRMQLFWGKKWENADERKLERDIHEIVTWPLGRFLMSDFYFEVCTYSTSVSHSIKNSSVLFIEYSSCSTEGTLLS